MDAQTQTQVIRAVHALCGLKADMDVVATRFRNLKKQIELIMKQHTIDQFKGIKTVVAVLNSHTNENGDTVEEIARQQKAFTITREKKPKMPSVNEEFLLKSLCSYFEKTNQPQLIDQSERIVKFVWNMKEIPTDQVNESVSVSEDEHAFLQNRIDLSAFGQDNANAAAIPHPVVGAGGSANGLVHM